MRTTFHKVNGASVPTYEVDRATTTIGVVSRIGNEWTARVYGSDAIRDGFTTRTDAGRWVRENRAVRGVVA